MTLLTILRYTVGGLLFIAGQGLLFYAMALNNQIVFAVNDKLPDDKKFGLLFWHPGKWARLNREYTRLYPDGTLRSRARLANLTGFGLLLSGAILVLVVR